MLAARHGRSAGRIDAAAAFVICSRYWLMPTDSQGIAGSSNDDGIFDQEVFDGGGAYRAFDIRLRAKSGACALGAEAGHGLWLRQGRQDLRLQDGYQQCRAAVEGRQEGTER